MSVEIKPMTCPDCGRKIIPDVHVHPKVDNIHEVMERLGATFFKHIDVYYRCACGFWHHKTYREGRLASSSTKRVGERKGNRKRL